MRKLEKTDSLKATQVAFSRRKIEMLVLFLVFLLCGTATGVSTGVITVCLLVRDSDIHFDTNPRSSHSSKLPESRIYCVRSVLHLHGGPGPGTVSSFLRAGYILCGAQCKVETQAPCSKIKKFKKDSAKYKPVWGCPLMKVALFLLFSCYLTEPPKLLGKQFLLIPPTFPTWFQKHPIWCIVYIGIGVKFLNLKYVEVLILSKIFQQCLITAWVKTS